MQLGFTNLDDIKTLEGIEDPVLVEWMNVSRDKLEEYNKEMSKLVSIDKIISDSTSVSRMMSSVIKLMGDHKALVSECLEDVSLQVSNIDKILEGTKPHGYPNDGRVSSMLSHLKKQLDSTVVKLRVLSIDTSEMAQITTISRQELDSAAGSSLDRHLLYEKIINSNERSKDTIV